MEQYKWSISCRALLSSTHHSNKALTDIIDVPAHSAQEGGGAAKGHFSVGGGFHVHVTALCVLARQPWWVSNGGVRVITVQGAGAVATHGTLDVICESHKTRTNSLTHKGCVQTKNSIVPWILKAIRTLC